MTTTNLTHHEVEEASQVAKDVFWEFMALGRNRDDSISADDVRTAPISFILASMLVFVPKDLRDAALDRYMRNIRVGVLSILTATEKTDEAAGFKVVQGGKAYDER